MSANILSNKTILQKADLALGELTTDGGVLQPAQAKKFIRVMIKSAALLPMATVVPMKAPKQLLEKIQFGSRIMRAGEPGTALAEADRSKPDLSKVELDAKLFKAEVRLNNETLEDSIERGQLKGTIMTLMAQRIALDTDEILVNGDTSSADAFLAQFDGALVSATSNVVDAGGVKLQKTILRDALRTMPQEFRKNKRTLRYLTSSNAEIDYRDTLSDRQTAMGDNALMQAAPTAYGSVPVVDIPVFPENQGTAPNDDRTSVLLTDPKNLNLGIWRRIQMETDKLVREGVVIIVATMRMDFKYTHEPAVVKATNVLVGG